MKGKSLSVLGIMAALAGLVLIFFHTTITLQVITVVFGILFLVVGLSNLIFFSSVNADSSSFKVMSVVSNAASIVLGVSMLVHMGTFVSIMSFMLCTLVAVCSLWQFFVLSIGVRPHQMPVWLYVFAVLPMAGAIYIYIIRGGDNESTMLLVTGISMAILGVGCVIEGSILGLINRREKKSASTAESAGETVLKPETDTRDDSGRKHPETTENLWE